MEKSCPFRFLFQIRKPFENLLIQLQELLLLRQLRELLLLLYQRQLRVLLLLLYPHQLQELLLLLLLQR